MLSRRQLVLGAATILAPPLRPVSAGLSCQDTPYGLQVCTVGVSIPINPAYQAQLHWCWAACVEAIFASHNHKVGQERIVEKVFGGDVDQGALGPQIVAAINGTWTGDDGEDTFTANAEVLWDPLFGVGRSDALLQCALDLEADSPLIVGAIGHANVLTEMTYSAAQVLQLVVLDPYPGNPTRRALSQLEMQNIQFLAKIEVSDAE